MPFSVNTAFRAFQFLSLDAVVALLAVSKTLDISTSQLFTASVDAKEHPVDRQVLACPRSGQYSPFLGGPARLGLSGRALRFPELTRQRGLAEMLLGVFHGM